MPNGDLIDIAFDGSGRVLAVVAGHVYRADASSTTLLHSALLQEDLAAGNSLLLAGPLLLDAAGGSQSGQAFVDGSALLQNLAVVSDDFVYAGDDGTIYAFTRSTRPVRGVRSTWSAVKARFH